MSISDCIFKNMKAGKQGGVIYSQNLINMSISNVTFASIKSQYYGDALYIQGADLVELTAINIEGFYNNAIYLQDSPLVLHNANISSII